MIYAVLFWRDFQITRHYHINNNNKYINIFKSVKIRIMRHVLTQGQQNAYKISVG